MNLGRILLTAALVASVSSVIAWAQPQTAVTFADAPSGRPPVDFEPMLTGDGPSGRWEVVADSGAAGGRAVAQVSTEPAEPSFPLLIYMPTVPADIAVTTAFKAVAGRIDQAGGLAVRLQNPQNYYVVRANALENNVRFYKVVGGRRQQLAGTNLPVTAGDWHELTLRAKGDQFAVVFNNRELFTVADQTFGSPGKVAFWTKADSVTHFDRLTIEPLTP